MLLNPKRKTKLSKLLHLKKLPFLPYVLGIETGNICNLKCPLCPTGKGDTSMKKGFMTLALFRKVFDELRQSLKCINMYSWGEPLLNNDFIPMLEYAKKLNKKIRIITSTNLNINNDALLERLMRSGVDEIIVSCDGTNQKSYEKYRVGGDYNLVMRNMKLLADMKKKFNAPPDIVWNFLVFRHNEDEIEEAKRIAAAQGVSLRIGKMRTYMKDEILRPHAESIEKYKEWIPRHEEYSAYDKDKCSTKKVIKTCKKPWQEISVNWNGDVFPCCAIYGDEFSFGNIRDGKVRAVWNNASYVRARREILEKKITPETICGICRSNGFLHM